MENLDAFTFLAKPKIDRKNLCYIQGTKDIYVNLYEIKIKKELKLYQYPFKVSPKIEDGDIIIREKLFKASYKELKSIYGNCFISGNSLYTMNKINESQIVKCILKGGKEYILKFNKFENEKIIKEGETHKDPLTKQFIEMIIRDILSANPKLELYKGFFVITDDKRRIETDDASITFYRGFTTSFIETDSGNYLNVALKNKIIQNDTILDYLNIYKYYNKSNHNSIKDDLIGRSFKVSYAKRNYEIDDILFDRSQRNQMINYEGKTINLIEYYEIAHNLKIKVQNQPLISVRRKDSQGNTVNHYFIPELCYLAGLDDNKDGRFLRELINFTKLDPKMRINKTNEFLNLLVDCTKDKDHPRQLSSIEKSELYGIEVKPLQRLFTGYYMEEPKLIGGNKKQIHSNDRTFPVLEKSDMSNWLCFYEKKYYDDAENLYKTLDKVSKSFELKISEPEWIEMPNNSKVKDWTDIADDYFGRYKNNYNFVIFLIGNNDYLYKSLKIHSLYKKNYVSQVVKVRTIRIRRRIMSICSKILLQINNKLGGISYKLSIDNNIKDRKLIIIGVDSSHIKNKRTRIAMVATMNDSFSDFFNKEDIIREENQEQLRFCISSFIREAFYAYIKKNRETPKGIIIYRQGVSFQQKDFLKIEIEQIDLICKPINVFFYYILVNKKENFKFYVKEKHEYSNPESGLLILDGITNRNYFEFYIQPQEVNQGSAIPVCYHVAYGNLDYPEIIPKLTYDLCHIYCNWEGKIRVPHVLKMAEKLSKMTAKYNIIMSNEHQFNKSYI